MKTYTIKTNDFKIAVGNGVIEVPTFEVSEETLKDLIKENPELLTPTPTHKRKYFVPKVGERYWYIGLYNTIDTSNFISTSNFDKAQVLNGNCFATEQDAQDELNRRQALVRIWNNYDDKYSWDIDWEDGTIKYTISYDFRNKKFDNTYNFRDIVLNTELPYFKSAEDRNQFVEDNMEDLLTIFNIKK